MSRLRTVLEYVAATLVFIAFVGTMALGSILEQVIG